MRNLSEYYQFNIEIKKSIYSSNTNQFYPVFKDKNNEPLKDYKSKLTPSQWLKASKYLNRKLVAFVGYQYEVKTEYQSEQIIKIK